MKPADAAKQMQQTALDDVARTGATLVPLAFYERNLRLLPRTPRNRLISGLVFETRSKETLVVPMSGVLPD